MIVNDIDFAAYADGTDLGDIDAAWVPAYATRTAQTYGGVLQLVNYAPVSYVHTLPGAAPLTSDNTWVRLADISAGGNGHSVYGAMIYYDPDGARWVITQSYSTKAVIPDAWAVGDSRRVVISHDGSTGLTLSVYDDAGVLIDTVATSAVDVTTSDLGLRWGNVNGDRDIGLASLYLATLAQPSQLQAYISGAWVPGTLRVRQADVWVPGVLKRFNGTSWD
jgi:hypothetical protein